MSRLQFVTEDALSTQVALHSGHKTAVTHADVIGRVISGIWCVFVCLSVSVFVCVYVFTLKENLHCVFEHLTELVW